MRTTFADRSLPPGDRDERAELSEVLGGIAETIAEFDAACAPLLGRLARDEREAVDFLELLSWQSLPERLRPAVPDLVAKGLVETKRCHGGLVRVRLRAVHIPEQPR